MKGEELRAGLARYLNEAQIAKLRSARIGIAGAGGLGSNVAMLLARSGVENFTIIDHDTVDKSNLNRQHFWPRHLGMQKIAALKESMLELNPNISLTLYPVYLDECSIPPLLQACPVWVEALDGADAKSLFVEKALLAERRVISASGICGIGGMPLQKKRMGALTLVGDFHTDVCIAPPMAPRVQQAAAIMADCVLEDILSG